MQMATIAIKMYGMDRHKEADHAKKRLLAINRHCLSIYMCCFTMQMLKHAMQMNSLGMNNLPFAMNIFEIATHNYQLFIKMAQKDINIDSNHMHIELRKS